MLRPLILTSIILLLAQLYAEEVDTRFLIPGELIFESAFDEGENAPGKPNWMLRKSTWVIEDGVLAGKNAGGNGPFIRLHSKEKGGVLPEDYVMKFSFRIEENPDEKKANYHDETFSSGHRFSLGHYAAKFQWRPDRGMDLNIGHGDALTDERFRIERGKWYHVTIEIRGDEVLTWFADGPAYYLQHDHFRHKPSGWEFFTHISEVGYLDNVRVWSLKEGDQGGWDEVRDRIIAEERAFISSDHPDFIITKHKTK